MITASLLNSHGTDEIMVILPYGSMYPNSMYYSLAPKYLYRDYFKAKVCATGHTDP